MNRYVAFLRAINVGGRRVRMPILVRIFESLGFAEVETFIASGNVIFSSKSPASQALEKKISRRLEEELGYAVAIFLRSPADIHRILKYQPCPGKRIQSCGAYVIGFMDKPADAKLRGKVSALTTDIDELSVQGKELYWLCWKRQSESAFSGGRFEKETGLLITLRARQSLEKLAVKYDWI